MTGRGIVEPEVWRPDTCNLRRTGGFKPSPTRRNENQSLRRGGAFPRTRFLSQGGILVVHRGYYRCAEASKSWK